MSTGFATVKEVLSGDTLVLIGPPKNGPPPEIRLNLANLQAPRLALRSGSEEQAFAWQSREFLRKLCIGKNVAFKIEYVVNAIGRTFGTVSLSPTENLNVMVARAGWADVKKDAREGERCSDLDAMVAASEAAKAEGAGIFGDKESPEANRTVKWDVEDPEALFKTIKSKPQRAIIEYVRDGAAFKALLLDSMTIVSFNLTGVACPRLNGASGGNSPANGKSNKPEEFSQEARYFTSFRMLNREVDLVFQGVEKNTFFGRIEHPAGNIGLEIVKTGLGKVSYWTLKWCPPAEAKALGEAQRLAQQGKLRVWRAMQAIGGAEVEGVVAEVVSADQFIIRVGTPDALEQAPWTCPEQKVFLSSISAPRRKMMPRGMEAEAAAASLTHDERVSNYYSNTAREFLRSKCVGKRCTVSVEYERSPLENSSKMAPKKYVTVLVNTRKGKVNPAVLVVKEGLANLVHHRRDQDERSAFYDEIVAAANEAEKAKRGVHADPKTLGTALDSLPQDLCGQPAKAKRHLGFLTQGAATHNALVEYCHNAARLKVYVPGENCTMNFALAGVSAPQRARGAQKGGNGKPARDASPEEAYAAESLAYTRAKVLQQEVEVHIETMDKGGTAIGTMWYTQNGQRTNLGEELVTQGLAKLNEYSANMSKHGDALFAAVKEPKKQRLRVWEGYDEAAELAAKEAAAALESGLNISGGDSKATASGSKQMTVTEIVNGNTLYLSAAETKEVAERRAAIEAALAAIAESVGVEAGAADSGIVEAKAGKHCLALFDDGSGNTWCRARIESVEEDGSAAVVRYIDFGNKEKVPMARLRESNDEELFAKAPLAELCELAFVEVQPLDDEFGTDAAVMLNSLVWGKTLEVQVFGREDNKLSVAIFAKETVSAEEQDEEEGEDDKKKEKKKTTKKTKSVNELLVAEGLGKMPKRVFAKGNQAKSVSEAMRTAQEGAHKAHLNMWRYGDIDDDDAKEFGAQGK